MHILQWLKEVFTSPGLTAIVNCASLIGLYLALQALRDGKALVRSIDVNAASINVVAQSLSTKFQAEWPHYLPKIAEVVSSARREVLIISLLPGIGILSAVDGWKQIAAAIAGRKHAPGGVRVTLLTGDEEFRLQSHRRQFEPAFQDWSGWQAKRSSSGLSNGELIMQLSKTFSVVRHTPRTPDELVQSLNAVQESLLRDVYSGTTIYRTGEYLPVFAWIADEERAVFGISNHTGVAPAFYTEDARIVKALSHLSRHYIATSQGRPAPEKLEPGSKRWRLLRKVAAAFRSP